MGRRTSLTSIGDEIQIQIQKWKDYNPRKDLKYPSWFRCENDILTNQKLFGLNPTQKFIWICLLGDASKKAKDGAAIVNLAFYAHNLGVDVDFVQETILMIEKKGLISVTSQTRSASVQVPNESGPYDTNDTVRTDVTNERDGTERHERAAGASDPKGQPPPSKNKLHKLALLWNENCGRLAKVKTCTASRNKKAEARWKECPDDDPDAYFGGVVQRIAKSDFCNGKNDRGWRATFDWLLRPETHMKVDEGKFDNRAGVSQTRAKNISQGNASLWDKIQQERG